MLIFGGGCPNIVEPEPLTLKVEIAVLWKKEQLDLAELARLRWVEKWTRMQIADHFGLSRTTVCNWLRQAQAIRRFGVEVL